MEILVTSLVLFPGKNLGAYGDGGAVVTNNKKIYEKILKLRTHGATEKFKHELVGINSRLHSMQAVVLNQKLKRISLINNKKRKIDIYYLKNINNKKIKLFKISRNSCFHQFVILVNKRQRFLNYLTKYKIPYGFHYPYTIHNYGFLKFCKIRNLNPIQIVKCGVKIPIDF